jgi:lipoate-protein ligase A
LSSFKPATAVRFLDLALATPAEQLACDEILLTSRDSEGGSGILRFWESPSPCVILGYTSRAETEVRLQECRANGIPVYRRTTGGGTVVQGPGCLNYALVLPIGADPQLATAGGTNRLLMRCNAAALQPCVQEEIGIQGFSDLTIGTRKFSGNAQRRMRRFLLFHGSLLLDFDLGLIEKFLPDPQRQPVYRNERRHGDFLRNLGIEPSSAINAIRTYWGAEETEPHPPPGLIARLARERYENPSWTLR